MICAVYESKCKYTTLGTSDDRMMYDEGINTTTIQAIFHENQPSVAFGVLLDVVLLSQL